MSDSISRQKLERQYHQQQILELSMLYAKAVDRLDFTLLQDIFSTDAELSGPEFHYQGLPAIVEGMEALKQFTTTFHAIHNSLIAIDDDRAIGEIYCVASHFYRVEQHEHKLDWGIRYQDSYQLNKDKWQISQRQLIIDWRHDVLTGNPID